MSSRGERNRIHGRLTATPLSHSTRTVLLFRYFANCACPFTSHMRSHGGEKGSCTSVSAADGVCWCDLKRASSALRALPASVTLRWTPRPRERGCLVQLPTRPRAEIEEHAHAPKCGVGTSPPSS
jgi:hypothetical protein